MHTEYDTQTVANTLALYGVTRRVRHREALRLVHVLRAPITLALARISVLTLIAGTVSALVFGS
jgi:hypothetical protein